MITLIFRFFRRRQRQEFAAGMLRAGLAKPRDTQAARCCLGLRK